MHEPIYLFYEEPDPYRWIPFDRYPRKIIRRIFRGKPKIGGVMRWYLNLRAGFDLLGVNYRINDYQELTKNPNAWACVVGKSHVLKKIPSSNPIMYGPGIDAHPYENDFLAQANNIKLILISCEWFQKMYERDISKPIATAVWPAGIEMDIWQPPLEKPKSLSLLIYDKVRWRRDEYEFSLIQPIRNQLESLGIKVEYLRYGFYDEDDYRRILQQVSGMVFLCEHETQGFAYLQSLSCDVPILAWDRGGYWQDPSMFPERVKFEPVTSVPYFDQRCGEKFTDMEEFRQKLPLFLENISNSDYRPRQYITENFDLKERAKAYLELLEKAKSTKK